MDSFFYSYIYTILLGWLGINYNSKCIGLKWRTNYKHIFFEKKSHILSKHGKKKKIDNVHVLFNNKIYTEDNVAAALHAYEKKKESIKRAAKRRRKKWITSH